MICGRRLCLEDHYRHVGYNNMVGPSNRSFMLLRSLLSSWGVPALLCYARTTPSGTCTTRDIFSTLVALRKNNTSVVDPYRSCVRFAAELIVLPRIPAARTSPSLSSVQVEVQKVCLLHSFFLAFRLVFMFLSFLRFWLFLSWIPGSAIKIG